MHEDIAAKAKTARTQPAQTQAAEAEGDGPHPDDDGPPRGTAAKKEKK